MHRPDLPHHISPLAYERGDLASLAIVRLGNVHEDGDFGIHQPDVGIEVHSGRDHAGIDGQGLSGLDDACVGFFGGHGGRLP